VWGFLGPEKSIFLSLGIVNVPDNFPEAGEIMPRALRFFKTEWEPQFFFDPYLLLILRRFHSPGMADEFLHPISEFQTVFDLEERTVLLELMRGPWRTPFWMCPNHEPDAPYYFSGLGLPIPAPFDNLDWYTQQQAGELFELERIDVYGYSFSGGALVNSAGKKAAKPPLFLYNRIRQILESARSTVARSVNTTQVVANWLVGREIVEEEQKGARRAVYGTGLLQGLSVRLTQEFGGGYSVNNLEHFRGFFLTYGSLVQISHAPRGESATAKSASQLNISHAVRGESALGIGYAVRSQSWVPGQLHPNLSWTHYRTLLRVNKPEARAFYEIEAIKNNWGARELERQICSLLYERLALSRDKKGLMRLATKGHVIQKATDVFKDPVVIEFLGLPESPKLVETDLETALIDNLQSFLLEMGKGFAFVARQQRLTLDGDHFYIDLVFYHIILKCYVIVDLKTGKLTHQDLGQLQLYVNYYDREKRTTGDTPTLGLILCAEKNDAVVRYTLGEDQKRIFTSRFKTCLPTEDQLRTEIRREIRAFRAPGRKAGNP
jgi:predicted nuclease of restriction endonuclease-like (RecB) superfamily